MTAENRAARSLRQRGPTRGHRIAVVPCADDRSTFHWLILAPDGTRLECSAYAFSTARGAEIAGAIRLVDARLTP